MTRFGKHLDRGLKSLAGEEVTAALADAGIDKSQLDAAYVGNAAASVITGQVCIPGQAVLRELGIGRIPVINMENACASSSPVAGALATRTAWPSHEKSRTTT